MPKKKEQEINIIVTFSEGWEDRFAKAAANLYYRIQAREEEEAKKEQERREKLC